MAEPGKWHASLLEQRIAWAVAASCLILVLLASARPAWFDFSTPAQTQATGHIEPVLHKTIPAKHSVAKRSITKRPVAKKAVAGQAVTPAKKLRAVHANTKPASTPARTQAMLAHGFYIQLGAFNERPRAQGLADRLQHQGWHTVIAPTQGGLHAVWIGPRPTRRGAEILLKTVHARLKNKGFIVHH